MKLYAIFLVCFLMSSSVVMATGQPSVTDRTNTCLDNVFHSGLIAPEEEYGYTRVDDSILFHKNGQMTIYKLSDTTRILPDGTITRAPGNQRLEPVGENQPGFQSGSLVFILKTLFIEHVTDLSRDTQVFSKPGHSTGHYHVDKSTIDWEETSIRNELHACGNLDPNLDQFISSLWKDYSEIAK